MIPRCACGIRRLPEHHIAKPGRGGYGRPFFLLEYLPWAVPHLKNNCYPFRSNIKKLLKCAIDKRLFYYADAVLWAVKEDISKGTTNTTFSPDADCTRAQIVTFLWRCKK